MTQTLNQTRFSGKAFDNGMPERPPLLYPTLPSPRHSSDGDVCYRQTRALAPDSEALSSLGIVHHLFFAPVSFRGSLLRLLKIARLGKKLRGNWWFIRVRWTELGQFRDLIEAVREAALEKLRRLVTSS